MRFVYSSDHLDFISEGYKAMGIPELTKAFNEAFSLDKTPGQIKCVISNHKFKCGRTTGQLNKGKSRVFTEEQIDFLRENYADLSRTELTEAFNQRFGTNVRKSQIVPALKRYGIRSGRDGRYKEGHESWNKGTKGLMKPNRTSFAKGSRPANHKPVGSERVNTDGYISVKTAEPDVWELKHRVVYEAEVGPIPEGYRIRFLDGDPLNCSPENMTLVDARENALLNKRYKLGSHPVEHRETIVLMARLDVKANRISESMEQVSK